MAVQFPHDTNRYVPPSHPEKAVEQLKEERHRKIAEAAYYRAEARNFAPGGEMDDWLEAEKAFDALFSAH